MSSKLSFTKTQIKAHYAVSKLMNSLQELAKLEYSHDNYGECVKRSIQWLKLYVAILPSYSDKFGVKSLVEPGLSDKYTKQYFYILHELSSENFDNVLNKYMDCNKFLVGPKVYQLVQKANLYLKNSNQWEVFMTFNDMVEFDKGYNGSDARDNKLLECFQLLTKVKKCSKETLEPFEFFLNKIHFCVTHLEKEQKPVVTAEKFEDYDIVNASNLYEDNDWTDVTTPAWANVIPQEFNDKCIKASNKRGMRLTPENATIGQTISYQTKKSIEYGKIINIKPTYVEIRRLAKQADGSFIEHIKPICKASGNKPAFTRVITII